MQFQMGQKGEGGVKVNNVPFLFLEMFLLGSWGGGGGISLIVWWCLSSVWNTVATFMNNHVSK